MQLTNLDSFFPSFALDYPHQVDDHVHLVQLKPTFYGVPSNDISNMHPRDSGLAQG